MRTEQNGRHRVVILGAGFAGVSVARHLRHCRDVEVTLIDRNNFSLFTPMLPEVASGAIEPRHIAQPLRAALRGIRPMLGSVQSVDFQRRSIALEGTFDGKSASVPFDSLVLALGAAVSTHGIPGAGEHTFALKSIDDAIALRSQTIRMLENASGPTSGEQRHRALTFVVVGGGFTGVEAAGELRGYLRTVARFFPALRRDEMRVILVAGSKRLLEQLPPRFGERALTMFIRRGIEVILDDDVASADSGGLTLKSGRRIASATIVWSAGVRPSPLVEGLDVPHSPHRAVVVNPDFSVQDRPGVWAAGDCAQIPKPGGGYFAQTAQDAVREGPLLARNIIAANNGKRTRVFRYRSPGMMASLGHREGLAEIGPGILIAGLPAWLLWRAYYLSRLSGAGQKVRVALDWLVSFFFPGDLASIR